MTSLRGVGERRAQSLAAMGLENVLDLLTTYPRRYVDRSRRVDVSDLSIGDVAAVYGEVTRVGARRTRQGRSLVEITLADGTGEVRAVFFNQPWRAGQLAVGVQALLFGTVGEFRGQRQLTNPVVDVIVGAEGDERDPSRVGRVVAIYPASGKAGVTSWELRGLIEESLRRAGPLRDPLPETIRRAHDLIDRTAAYWAIHVPDDVDDVAPARRRLVFDEFLRLQVLLARRRERLTAHALGVAHPIDEGDLDAGPGDDRRSLLGRFIAGHRFRLTDAQRRVLGEIASDMGAPTPMHRLLQGDVGSGKTLVALATMLMAVGAGRQAALMAPTEILAEQHVAALRGDLEGLEVEDPSVLGGRRGVRVALLTGRLRAAERRATLAAIVAGEVDIVVGTHALVSEGVRFAALGVVVIDEQHRFGVEQRAALRSKGRDASDLDLDPDLLVMTATPIPRTAAMVHFADLERSVLDERPPGREAVRTVWLDGDPDIAWDAVRATVASGHRAYVVCPLVEGGGDGAGAVAERDRLAAGPLAGLRLGLAHGQMRSEEREAAMDDFRAGRSDVLVATVVIEVGVDVPEASVIVIEDAWRFGLAQLHQLRGRVGRGTTPGTCYLLGPAASAEARARLEALVASSDGFALAEIDLALRGEGTLLGARQRGPSDLRLASLVRDEDELRRAAEVARDLVAGGLHEVPDLVDELRALVDPEEADFLFKS